MNQAIVALSVAVIGLTVVALALVVLLARTRGASKAAGTAGGASTRTAAPTTAVGCQSEDRRVASVVPITAGGSRPARTDHDGIGLLGHEESGRMKQSARPASAAMRAVLSAATASGDDQVFDVAFAAGDREVAAGEEGVNPIAHACHLDFCDSPSGSDDAILERVQ